MGDGEVLVRPGGGARGAHQRAHEVHDEVFDLFAALDANDEQLDFPMLFASGKDGWASKEPTRPVHDDMAPLFDLICRHVSPPDVDEDGPFSMLVTTLERDPHLGRLLTGRIFSGNVLQRAMASALLRSLLSVPLIQHR